MPWPKNPDAEKMYALYKQGFSLADVGAGYGKTRQSVHGLFKYRGWATRKKKRPLPFVHFSGCKYTLRNTGYYGKTTGRRTLLHRDVWEQLKGKIPKGFDIHHIDEDRANNNIENLECLPKPEHTRLYSPHNNQYTKGRKKK